MNAPGEDRWSADKGWVTDGSSAPILRNALRPGDSPVAHSGSVDSNAGRVRATEPFHPRTADPLVGASSRSLASTSAQRPARRRSDRLWLRRFSRPGRSLTGVLGRDDGGLFAGLPASALPIVMAVPIALVALALVLNTIVLSRGIIAEGAGVIMPALDEEGLLAVQEPSNGSGGSGQPLSIDPTTFEKIRRVEYVVQPGDTISEIAVSYGLEPGTILSMNPISDVRRLLPGTTLFIPNRDGLFHSVSPGESIHSIADDYGVPVSAILDANDIESSVLQVGDDLFIPGAEMPQQDYLLAIGELFQWPVRRFYLTSGFGMRVHPISGVWSMHTGIDLANSVGTPVLAAGSGRVVHVENQTTNYGKMIIIDHGNGYRTLYGHLNSFNVSWGDYVNVGQQIGTMGTTGRSTGPHLHFAVFRGSQPIDPLSQLRDR